MESITEADTFDDVQEFDPFDVDNAIDVATPRPTRTTIYGTHGVGKTTLASHFPNPIALFTEDGVRNIQIRRFPVVATSYQQVVGAITSVLRNPKDLKTFVLDSLDWLEPLVWAETCSRNNIDSIEAAGYGKGYMYADDVWAELLRGFDALRDAGLHVLLLAHAEITTFNPPDSDKYDRYDLALHKRARAMIHEWADVVGFAYEKTVVTQKTEGQGKTAKTITKGGSSLGRYLALERRSTWEAKNGFGLPSEIPLSNDQTTADELLGRIAHSFHSPE